ncbi:MAG: hypothetical protein ABIG42_00250 [bacterium]
MKLTDRILYSLLAIALVGMIATSGCNARPSSAATEKKSSANEMAVDNSIIFKSLSDAVEENEITSISVIRIDDMVEDDITRERQVTQGILEELTKIEELKLVEADSRDIDEFFMQKGIDPGRGMNTDSSVSLARFLDVDAIIYGTIESNKIDVNLKMYSAKHGGILFSQTLDGMKLPMGIKKLDFEIPEGLLDTIPEQYSESSEK